MKKYFGILMLGIAALLAGCADRDIEQLDESLTACAPCPVALTSCTAFVADGSAYIFGGRDSIGQRSNRMWRYDASDQWTDLGEMPIQKRVKGVACTVDEDVYLGLGFDGDRAEFDSCYLRDFWRYRPTTDEWTRLADFPTLATDGAVAMADGQYIYVCYGCNRYFLRDVWVYSIADNSWTQMADNTASKAYPPRALSCTGAKCHNRMFVGTGFHSNSLTFWVELTGRASTTDGDIWHKCHALPGKGRNAAAATADDSYIYVAGGRYYGGTVTDGRLHDDILRYDPDADTWARVCTLPCPTENMVAFTLGGHAYFGLGNDKYDKPVHGLYRL